LYECYIAKNNLEIERKNLILEFYQTAKMEGFSPFEARMLIEVKVVGFND
jgi:hypothetical protein